MTHHRKRHKARRRRRNLMRPIQVSIVFKKYSWQKAHDTENSYKAVSIQAHAGGSLEVVSIEGETLRFQLANIVRVHMLPNTPPVSKVSDIEAYEAG